MSSEQNLWWGYKHVSGTYQAKRFFNDMRDVEDAIDSSFVERVVYPFPAENRDEALKHIESITN
jgi:hypothetical protein